jgi:hypothetical protein
LRIRQYPFYLGLTIRFFFNRCALSNWIPPDACGRELGVFRYQRQSDPTIGYGDINILLLGGGLRHHGWCGVVSARRIQKKKNPLGRGGHTCKKPVIKPRTLFAFL